MLSRRCAKSRGSPNLLHAAWYRQHENPYHEENNPNGIINLGTAENRVLYDIIQEKLSTIDLGNISEEYTHYCKLSGTDQFRNKLSAFFNQYMKPTEKINGEDVFVMNGCGTVVEALGYAICDEGDGVLIPAPYYCGFKSDLEQRIGIKTVPVYLSSKTRAGEKPFQMTVDHLEKAFMQAEEGGIPVKALLLSNPNNPLGNIYTEEELKTYVQFCDEYNIHLICDEIYMMSVYDETANFQSLLSLKDITKSRDNVHVIWGFSKDFSLSGFRCGVAITHNEGLQTALTSMGYYTSVPTVTQYVLEELITDQTWLDKLTSTNHKRLIATRDLVTAELSRNNIPYISPFGGLFVWMNLSKCLASNTKESETNLFNSFMNNGIYIVPGFAFECMEHGWFRIIISNELNLLKVALQRIINTVIRIGTKRHQSESTCVLESFAKSRSINPITKITSLNTRS